MLPTRPRPEILYAGMSTSTQEMKAAITGGNGNWWKGFAFSGFRHPFAWRRASGSRRFPLWRGHRYKSRLGVERFGLVDIAALRLGDPGAVGASNRLRYFASMAWAEALISRAMPLKTRGDGIMAATVRDLS